MPPKLTNPKPTTPATGSGTRAPAAHVRAALSTLQAKLKETPGARPPAAHLMAALHRPVNAAASTALQPSAASHPRPRPAFVKSGAVQRASALSERKAEFKVKMEEMRAMPHEVGVLDPSVGQYGGQASLDEIAATAFSSLGSRATGAVALLSDRTLVYAGQGGVAKRNWATLKKEVAIFGSCESGDDMAPDNMHAEMILVLYSLKNGKTISAIGVKDKGCCRLCAAALTHLGISYTRTQASIYESQWKDPWEFLGLKSPLGKGSGLSSMEAQLL
jgi:hypothetical protein